MLLLAAERSQVVSVRLGADSIYLLRFCLGSLLFGALVGGACQLPIGDEHTFYTSFGDSFIITSSGLRQLLATLSSISALRVRNVAVVADILIRLMHRYDALLCVFPLR